MSNYTKTTNFTAKDSLLVGDPNKIIKGAEHDVEYDAIATAVNSKANISSPTFTGTANFSAIASGALTGTTINNSVIGGVTPAAGTFSTFTLASGATVTAILDEDALTTNSDTALATQQSIKAYVDAQVVAAGPLLTTGTITANDFARFTDSTTLEGRSAAEVRADLDLEIGTDVQAYDADTVKLDVVQTFTAAQTLNSFSGTLSGALVGADNTVSRVNLLDYGEVTNAIGSTGGGTQDIDLTLGNVVTATVDTSANTFTFSNPTASDEGCGFTLILTNGGSQTVNWPASVDWPAATAPTLTAAGVDILVFTTVDGGTTWYGNLVGAAYA
jgi:hypothetical protein